MKTDGTLIYEKVINEEINVLKILTKSEYFNYIFNGKGKKEYSIINVIFQKPILEEYFGDKLWLSIYYEENLSDLFIVFANPKKDECIEERICELEDIDIFFNSFCKFLIEILQGNKEEIIKNAIILEFSRLKLEINNMFNDSFGNFNLKYHSLNSFILNKYLGEKYLLSFDYNVELKRIKAIYYNAETGGRASTPYSNIEEVYKFIETIEFFLIGELGK